MLSAAMIAYANLVAVTGMPVEVGGAAGAAAGAAFERPQDERAAGAWGVVVAAGVLRLALWRGSG